MHYLRDDNQKIEPEWYMPIIPMVLVNGAEGIGTGWMTKIANHNPREIVQNLQRMIRGDEPLPMVIFDEKILDRDLFSSSNLIKSNLFVETVV